ncbi:MAG TPA: hypothetical protein VFB03_00500 [Candidatus Saccharimonadales bacterium]|nr:hypothetical protein [Candidatus Saccharimonadales bacterium]
MKNFVYLYYGMEGGMDEWKAWFGKLGDKIVDTGNPFKGGKAVMKSGVSDVKDPVPTGYSIVKAESLDEAIEMSKGCPSLGSDDGAVCVYETMPM